MNCRREKAGLPVDDEQEYLPLSWLSQADYCLRRAALLLNERVWVENVETAKGRAEHERVHTQRVERRGDRRVPHRVPKSREQWLFGQNANQRKMRLH